jgi:hypothetical protein
MADGGPVTGGIVDLPAGTDNDLLTNGLARFAVEEHNKKAVSPRPRPTLPLRLARSDRICVLDPDCAEVVLLAKFLEVQFRNSGRTKLRCVGG